MHCAGRPHGRRRGCERSSSERLTSPIVTRVDYGDSREANRSTFTFDAVQSIVTIEAARFARRAPLGPRR